MRDRAFTERLQQIKAKYGYANHEPTLNIPSNTLTHRDQAPKAFTHREHAPITFTQRNQTPTNLTHRNQVPTNPESYHHSPRQYCLQSPKNHLQNFSNINHRGTSKADCSLNLFKEQIPYKRKDKKWDNLEGSSPIRKQVETSYSPIKQLASNENALNFLKNVTSPSTFTKPFSNASPLKEYNNQPMHNDRTSIKGGKLRQDECLKQNDYHKQKGRVPRPNDKGWSEFKLQANKGSDHKLDSQKGGEENSIGHLQKFSCNIDNIDKMQDRIALALKKYK